MSKLAVKSLKGLLAKVIFVFIIAIFWISCTVPIHEHDGVYTGPMSTWIIDGNNITIIFLNIETKGKVKFENNTAYIGEDNFRQIYQIEYDIDSTKMFVAGSGMMKIHMKRISDIQE